MNKARKIVLNPFCFRQFEKGGPNFIDCDKEKFVEKINELYDPKNLKDGYAPFCKHLFVKNFTPAILGYAEITPENEPLLRTKYEARAQNELPVLVRFFPAESLKAKVADYLDIILYSKEQIQAESKATGVEDPDKDVDYEWGIVSIKPQDVDYELPMQPITMMRNALGKEEGGSGVPLNREKYMEAVEFWSKNAMIK